MEMLPIDEDFKLPIVNNPLKIQALPDRTVIDFYMPQEIKDRDDYIDFLRAVTDARPTDEINLHINCYGGDLNTAFNIIDVLQNSQATINISVEGACASAATLIALSGDSWDIMPHSYFMCHGYTTLRWGKMQEVKASAKFDEIWLDKAIREIYKGFLTDDEINRMFKGEDFYFDADEIVERLNSYKKDEREREEVTAKVIDKYQKLINDELTKELKKFDDKHTEKQEPIKKDKPKKK